MDGIWVTGDDAGGQPLPLVSLAKEASVAPPPPVVRPPPSNPSQGSLCWNDLALWSKDTKYYFICQWYLRAYIAFLVTVRPLMLGLNTHTQEMIMRNKYAPNVVQLWKSQSPDKLQISKIYCAGLCFDISSYSPLCAGGKHLPSIPIGSAD